MSKALVVVLAPYFTFMRRFQFFPSMSHIPGHLNELADEQNRFKQPLSVSLDPEGFRDIPWQEQDLLRLLGVFVTQHGRKWFCIWTSSIVKKSCGSPLTGGFNRLIFGDFIVGLVDFR